jgi:hypothetical protein
MPDNTSDKVPILECVRASWAFLIQHWRLFLSTAAVVAAISQLGVILSFLTAPADGQPQSALQAPIGELLIYLPAVIAGVFFVAAVLRKVVRDEFIGQTGLAFGADERQLLGVMLAMACLYLPLAGLVAVVLIVTVLGRIATTPDALEALLADPEAMNDAIAMALGETGSAALSLFIIIIFAIFILIAARLSMVNAATIGERRIVIFQTWSWTRGNVLRVIAALILTFLPVIMINNLIGSVAIAIMRSIPGAGESIPLLVLASFAVSFATTMTSIPTIALGAVLYKGLRPREFVAK